MSQPEQDKTPVSARIHSGAVRGWPSVALAKHFYEGTRQCSNFQKSRFILCPPKFAIVAGVGLNWQPLNFRSFCL
uniref:Uncharacterized protein n=1 Tax=Inoviridae sp. ctNqM18 TaxID=2825780 RepID=A0A8S5U230_9VIRU|nr:MAG TPA: hypothetical protein [Inoviridae sp. ctNqM18]